MTDVARRRWLATAPMLVLAGCARMPRMATDSEMLRDQWSGRMALRVDSDPPQSFSAAFDLRGNARSGELSLFTPLGSTLARLRWAPGLARLEWNGERRSFDSLGALTRQATGTDLPITSLFAWLSGHADPAEGWLADLSRLRDGRLVARRVEPSPAVTMQLVLD